MASVFDSDDYKSFLKEWISERPKGGRGEARRMAEKLGVSTTLISQILNGDKHFTLEAASDLCDHLGLSEQETDHFLLLIDYARAGSHGLRKRLKRRIDLSRETARKIKERFREERSLTDAEAAIYYSHWVYTGVTHLIATEPRLTIDDISARLQVPKHMIHKVMSFLLDQGILVNDSGAMDIGTKVTVIGADSPLVVKHHQNWRLQAFNRMPFAKDSDLFITVPMSVSAEVADRIRQDLPAYFEKLAKWVGPSKSEVVRCLNIDWFEY